jgi:hypothetical protein
MNTKQMKSSLLAPCGINCAVCMAYLREKNRCLGCRTNTTDKPITRAQCKIKNCDELNQNNFKFCFKCKKFPCERMKHMDKRYRTRYKMSTIENLENIKKLGVREFIRNEKIRWACSQCGGTISVHRGYCYSCGKKAND